MLLVVSFGKETEIGRLFCFLGTHVFNVVSVSLIMLCRMRNYEAWCAGKDVRGKGFENLYRAKLFKLRNKIQFLPPSVYSAFPLQRSVGQ
jgi:hypothetical protein